MMKTAYRQFIIHTEYEPPGYEYRIYRADIENLIKPTDGWVSTSFENEEETIEAAMRFLNRLHPPTAKELWQHLIDYHSWLTSGAVQLSLNDFSIFSGDALYALTELFAKYQVAEDVALVRLEQKEEAIAFLSQRLEIRD